MTDGIVDTMSNRFPNKMPECQMDGISEYMSDIINARQNVRWNVGMYVS
jgi:hypothetical protein